MNADDSGAALLTLDAAAERLGVSVFGVLDLLDEGVEAVHAEDGDLCLDAAALGVAVGVLERAERELAANTSRTVPLGPQLFVGEYAPSSKRLLPPGPAQRSKPGGGLWTSTYRQDIGSAFLAFERTEERARPARAEHGWLLSVPAARVLSMAGRADVEAFYRRYLRPEPPQLARIGRRADWVRVARDFDAVHLGEDTGRRADVGDDIYGWDVESTWWCRWPAGATVRPVALPDPSAG